MRYQVGEKLITVFFEIEGRKLSDWFIMPYLYDMHKVEKVWLKELEVKEHHKVHWEIDPEKKKDYDGYILHDQTGISGTISIRRRLMKSFQMKLIICSNGIFREKKKSSTPISTTRRNRQISSYCRMCIAGLPKV